MLSCTFVSQCRQSVRAPVERFLFIALLAHAGIFQPAAAQAETVPQIHQHLMWDMGTATFHTIFLESIGALPADEAYATTAEIMTRPAMGSLEDGYRLATLPLRYYIVDPYPGNRDWRIWTAPVPPEPYPAFVRQMPGTEHGVLFENDDVAIIRRDPTYFGHIVYDGYLDGEPWTYYYNVPVGYDLRTELRFASGWTIVIFDEYPLNQPSEMEDRPYWWPAQLRFISPDEEISDWSELFLIQNHGTQQQELRVPGQYTFTIWPEGPWPQINVRIHKKRISVDDHLPPEFAAGVLTDLEIEMAGSWQVSFGRNGEVRVKADDWQPAAASLVAYSDDRASGPEAMGPSRSVPEEAERRFGVFGGKLVVDDFADEDLLVDFGRVALGESWAMPLYFFNAGAQEIVDLGLGLPDHPAFTLEGDPLLNPSMPPEGWVIYDLRFEPTEVAEYGATMTTSHGLTIRLTGQGITLEDDPAPEIPTVLAISGIVPNPFNISTTIWLDLPESGAVTLSVHDPRGRLVRTLWEGHQQAGRHPVVWNGLDDQGIQASSGVYLVILEAAGAEQQTAKAALVK